MTGTGYTEISESLKRDYLPVLQKQIEKKVKTWDIFGKSGEGIRGRDLYIKNFYGFPQGVGPKAAEATLPTPSASKFKESQISVKRNYAVVAFDAMLDEEKNSIVDLIDFEMTAAEDSLQKELNYQLAYGDGTGQRAVVNGTVTTTTVVAVDLPDGRPGVDFLAADMYIDLGTGVLDKKIASVDSDTQITLAEAVSCNDNTVIYRSGAKDVTMMGIPGIVLNNGALQGITESWWVSKAYDKGAKWGTNDATFLDSIQEAVDYVRYNSNGQIDLIYAWPLFARQYRYAMEAKRRIVNTLKFKEGREGLSYVTEEGEISILSEPYLPWLKVFFLDSSKLEMRTLRGIHWEEKDGSILRFLERKDIFTAWLKLYAEFITTQRNAHAYWYNTGTTVGDYT